MLQNIIIKAFNEISLNVKKLKLSITKLSKSFLSQSSKLFYKMLIYMNIFRNSND